MHDLVEGANAAGPDLSQVRQYWEANPLSTFESHLQIGTPAFFDWYNDYRCSDNEAFTLHLHEFDQHAGERVLDIGCGVGWLCRNFALGGANVMGVDVTRRGVELTHEIGRASCRERVYVLV